MISIILFILGALTWLALHVLTPMYMEQATLATLIVACVGFFFRRLRENYLENQPLLRGPIWHVGHFHVLMFIAPGIIMAGAV